MTMKHLPVISLLLLLAGNVLWSVALTVRDASTMKNFPRLDHVQTMKPHIPDEVYWRVFLHHHQQTKKSNKQRAMGWILASSILFLSGVASGCFVLVKFQSDNHHFLSLFSGIVILYLLCVCFNVNLFDAEFFP
jgi:hypothetical protein